MISSLQVDLRSAWRQSLWPLAALLTALLLLYHQTAENMMAIWIRSETYTHAFVVPPIVAWLIWRKRAELSRTVPRVEPWMLVPMGVFALVWLLGDLVVANSVTQLAFTAMLVTAVPFVLGTAVWRKLMFPLVFLFFAVPMGEALTPQLMQWTADFTVMAVRASGVPVYREGLQFVIPSGRWSVVEACSGIRYLMASFMVGSLFAYLNYQSLRRRILFVGFALVMPVAANWIRAYMIVMLGHLSDNAIATGADHLLYGWVFFGIVILSMFFVGARWAEPELAAEVSRDYESAAAPTASQAMVWSIAAVGVALVLLPRFVERQMAPEGPPKELRIALRTLPSHGWVPTNDSITEWAPTFNGASAEVQQTYRLGDSLVGVHIAYYRDQTESRKLVSSGNVLVRSVDERWILLHQGRLEVPIGQPQLLPLRSAEIIEASRPGQGSRQRLQVWHLYWVGGQFTTSDLAAKLLVAWQRLRGQGDESAAILFVADEPESGAASARLEGFVRANILDLDALLRAVAHASGNS